MTQAVKTHALVEPVIVELAPRTAAVVRLETTVTRLPEDLAGAFELTAKAITTSGGTIAGPPILRYLEFGDAVVAEAGFPYAGPLVPGDRVYPITIAGGRAVTATHIGAYEDIAVAWEHAQGWIRERGLELRDPPWESYLTGPDMPGPPVTELVFPIR
jgi:effector-binding domain-containing protein